MFTVIKVICCDTLNKLQEVNAYIEVMSVSFPESLIPKTQEQTSPDESEEKYVKSWPE
jgi:hypothetical protein